MIFVRYFDLSTLGSKILSASQLSNSRERKVSKYSLLEDRQRMIAAWLLLENSALSLFNIETKSLELLHLDNGKPYFKGFPFHFNISHSHNVVVVALSEQEIGVDVEMIDCNKELKERLLSRFTLSGDANEQPTREAFFERWSIYEADYKLTGSDAIDDKNYVIETKKITDSENNQYFLAVSAYNPAVLDIKIGNIE